MPATVLLTNTSWWSTSTHVAIALAQAGLQVSAIYPRRGHPLAKTRAVASRYVYRAFSPLASLAQAIRSSGADWILPCDDRAVAHLHQLHAAAIAGNPSYVGLIPVLERSLGAPSAYPIVASRAELLQCAQAAGILTPATVAIGGLDDLLRELDDKSFPVVLKMDGSWGGLGIKVVHSRDEAIACYKRMITPLSALATLKRLVVNRDPFWVESWRSRAIGRVSLQSFVTGRPANCVIFCKEGEVLASLAVEVESAQSQTGPATVVRLVEGKAMLRTAQVLAATLKLSGMHGLDFMLQASTGSAYLIELNARCAMPCHLRAKDGRDLIGALATELQGSSLEPSTPVATGQSVAYFPQAWLADSHNPLLRLGFHDVPWGEPELVQELFRLPWPDRSLLARLSDRLRGTSLAQRSARTIHFKPSALPEAAPQISPRHLFKQA